MPIGSSKNIYVVLALLFLGSCASNASQLGDLRNYIKMVQTTNCAKDTQKLFRIKNQHPSQSLVVGVLVESNGICSNGSRMLGEKFLTVELTPNQTKQVACMTVGLSDRDFLNQEVSCDSEYNIRIKQVKVAGLGEKISDANAPEIAENR